METIGSAYGHHVRRVGRDHFVISWRVDTKLKGSRLRHPRTFRRDTDEAGARRFAAKWGCRFPEPKEVAAHGR